MDTKRQADSRANQKARTRSAIVEAAQRLRRGGVEAPTVAQAAQAAQVSRATAYRYFPTQDALFVELQSVTPTVVPVENMLSSLTSEDVGHRLELLLETFGPIVLSHEEHLRRALAVYLDTWLRNRRSGSDQAPAVREGRRMRWLDHVLMPLDELPDHTRRRLRAALALTLGIDSVVVMKDVCQLDNEEALDVLRWTATTILRAVLESSSSDASA